MMEGLKMNILLYQNNLLARFNFGLLIILCLDTIFI